MSSVEVEGVCDIGEKMLEFIIREYHEMAGTIVVMMFERI